MYQESEMFGLILTWNRYEVLYLRRICFTLFVFFYDNPLTDKFYFWHTTMSEIVLMKDM